MENRITDYWPIHLTSSDWDVREQYEASVHRQVTRIQIKLYDAIRYARKHAWSLTEQMLDNGTDPARICEAMRLACEENERKLRLSAQAKIRAKLETLPSRREGGKDAE